MKFRDLSWKVALVTALCGVLGVLVTATFVRLTQRGVIAGSLGPTLGWVMEHGERARCEAAPDDWSLVAPNAGSIFAYDPTTLRSHNPRAPVLDALTQHELRTNATDRVLVRLFGLGRGGLVSVRVKTSGPCGIGVVFWRSTFTRLSAFISLALCGLITGGLSASISLFGIVRPLARRLSKVSVAARLVGAPSGYIASEIDGTDDLGRLARELDRAHARIRGDAVELENRRRELQDHIADVAHDIRTPLASLQLALQEARSQSDDGVVVRASLERALEDVVYVGGLIGNLRLASELRHGWNPPPRPRQSLADTLERSVLRLRFLAEQKGMSLEVATPDEPLFVAADPIALEQALVNVIENAVVHGSHEGHVAALLEHTATGFQLTVVDDGPGVEPEDLPRLFERHFRAEGADAQHARGAGLGLAITHEVCRRLDYTLTFSRELPSGLRVTISGPREPNV